MNSILEDTTDKLKKIALRAVSEIQGLAQDIDDTIADKNIGNQERLDAIEAYNDEILRLTAKFLPG